MVASVGSGSNRKGAQFERNTSKKLTKMFNIEFHRTAYSGSTSNSNAQSGLTGWTGDLFAQPGSDLDGLFSFELKNHQKMRLKQIFINGSIFTNFLQQNVEDARRQHAVPVLIMHSAEERQDIVTIPYQEEAYEALLEKDQCAMVVHSKYTDERTEETNQFKLIVTDLNGFGAIGSHALKEYYHDLDWDYLNTEKTKDFTPDIDELINETVKDNDES